MLKISGSIGIVLALAASVAVAQSTQTYSYDVHGRLTTATVSGTTARTTTYGIDDADNRTSRATVTGVSLLASPIEHVDLSEMSDTPPEAGDQARAIEPQTSDAESPTGDQ